ncbi:MFS transporter [Streptomyces sp. NPDC020379]|uniref:MFS transporter n=1 Tax=Streptomyces sp. NPDC020379 TaxID=3365071 RepID=UPI0037960028
MRTQPTAQTVRTGAVGSAEQPQPTDGRRWLALGVIAIAQLMVVLDASIVNIAMPSAQIDLGISDANRQWMVTAYMLAFGGLLMLGGRISDFAGRKRMFLIGLFGFAAASVLGGAATGEAMLYASRALQGVFAAVLAPAALSLLTVTFTDAKERARAFGVYGAVTGGGAAIGLISGGVLTEYLNWRWCMYVNVPIALVAAFAGVRLLDESRADGRTRYDVPGAVLSSTGLVALVYGFTQAEQNGWSSPRTWLFLAAGAVLLAAFFTVQARSDHPMLPLRVLTDRNRAGAFLTSLLTGLALFGFFLFMTYYFQVVLGYSALQSGFAYLPFSAGMTLAAYVASSLLPRYGPRPLMLTGFLLAIGAMVWLARLTPTSSYAAHALPAMAVLAFGIGLSFVPLASTALIGVENRDAGIASALVNSTYQIGGSLGTALLNTLAASATAGYLAAHPATGPTATARQVRDQGLVHGYSVAYLWSAAFLLAAAAGTALLIKASPKELDSMEQAVAMH